jgi:hypothetical protein
MILIPALIQGQLTGIYTIGNGNGYPEMVAYRENFGNQIEVLSGLSADERYIASAEGKLFNGAKLLVFSSSVFSK